jgi:alpha-ketoglutarate-dependent taurine dioxygenase
VTSTFITTDQSRDSTDRSLRGIIELETDSSWAIESAQVAATLAEHYGAGVTGSALTPPAVPADLRAKLRASAPGLTSLTDRIQAEFDNGACGIFVPRLGLAGLDVDERRKSVFALAALLGTVTETEPVDHRVIWDVRPQEEDLRKFSHFSESDREADYHTDSTIVPVPERYFLLYAVQQAECGGGLSTLRDGRVVREQLEATEDGRTALRVLTETALPLRIPRAFRKKYGYKTKHGYTFVPIFAERPMWRWRRDKIEQGLVANPEYATPEVRAALGTVDALLAEPGGVTQPLPTDGLVIIDNHVSFHGRTSFTDPRRHLLRIRFAEAD